MNKKRIYDIGGSILFLFFCSFFVFANVGDILKVTKDKYVKHLSKITDIINRINNETPYQVGANRWFIGVELIKDTLVYKYELRCNKKTENFYFKYEKDMRHFSLLSFKMMNEQNEKHASRMSTILKSNHLVLKYSTKMPSSKNISYVYTADEIAKFMNDSSLVGENALMSYIKTLIDIESLSLPIVTTESGKPINVKPNTKPNSLEYLILKDIKLQRKSVVFYYSTPEINYPISISQKGCKDEEDIRHIIGELCKDPYFKGFVNYFAMAKCNMILRYKGARSLQSMDINFPYQLLREYSYIPKDLLDKK